MAKVGRLSLYATLIVYIGSFFESLIGNEKKFFGWTKKSAI
ncbi:hypothetical protein [Geobacillus sp. FSL K6-3411]